MMNQNIDQNKKDKNTSIPKLVEDVFNDSSELSFVPKQEEDIRNYIDKKLTSDNLKTKLGYEEDNQKLTETPLIQL